MPPKGWKKDNYDIDPIDGVHSMPNTFNVCPGGETEPVDSIDEEVITHFKTHIQATLNGSQPEVTLLWVQGLSGYISAMEMLKKA